MKVSEQEIIKALLQALKTCAFAIESAAHLRGLEQELLPVSEYARSVINYVEAETKEDQCKTS